MSKNYEGQDKSPDVSTAKDFWDILNILSQLVAAIGIPCAIVWVGVQYLNANRITSAEQEQLQLAVELLADEPTLDNVELRQWALYVLSENSEIPLPQGLKTQVQCEAALSRGVLETGQSGSVLPKIRRPRPGEIEERVAFYAEQLNLTSEDCQRFSKPSSGQQVAQQPILSKPE